MEQKENGQSAAEIQKEHYAKLFKELQEKNPDITTTPDGNYVNAHDEKGNRVGWVVGFNEGNGKLLIMSVKIKEEYRSRGIAKMLYARLLMEYPETKIISGTLGDESEIEFWKNVKNDMSMEAAVKNTAQYKIRSSLGFTELLEIPPDDLPRNAPINISTVKPNI